MKARSCPRCGFEERGSNFACPECGQPLPQLRRSRSAAESSKLYSQANAELYDTLECLSAPARCNPDLDAKRLPLLAPALGAPRRMGYARSFHAGPAPAVVDGECAPSCPDLR